MGVGKDHGVLIVGIALIVGVLFAFSVGAITISSIDRYDCSINLGKVIDRSFQPASAGGWGKDSIPASYRYATDQQHVFNSGRFYEIGSELKKLRTCIH